MTRSENLAGAHEFYGAVNRSAHDMPDYGAIPAAVVLAYAKNLSLEDITLIWPVGGANAPRHALYGDGLDGLQVADFDGDPASGETMPCKIENSRNVSLPAFPLSPKKP